MKKKLLAIILSIALLSSSFVNVVHAEITTVLDVINTYSNFPESITDAAPDNPWVNVKGSKLYVGFSVEKSEQYLYCDGQGVVKCSHEVTKNDTNYEIVDEDTGAKIIFVMNEDVLDSIKFENQPGEWNFLNGIFASTMRYTIADILDTVDGGFSRSIDDETIPEDAWSTLEGYRLFFSSDKTKIKISEEPFYIDASEVLTKDSDGNYITTITIYFYSDLVIDIKMVMDDNDLSKVEVVIDGIGYIFEPMGDRKTVSYILDNYTVDFPDSEENGWVNENDGLSKIYRKNIYVDDVLIFSNVEDGAWSTSFLLNPSGSNYVLDYYGFVMNFNIENNKLKNIQIVSAPTVFPKAIIGTYSAPVTIASLLDTIDNFPQTSSDEAPDDAWVNKNGNKAFINKNDKLFFEGLPGDFAKNTVLIKDGNNYKTPMNFIYLTFKMDSNVLKEIECNYMSSVITFAPYEFVNDENEITKGATSEIVFKTNANYQNNPDNVTVKVKLEGETSSTTLLYDRDYSLETGSTIVKLKGDYVKTLPKGKHTITIIVSGYSPISQNFNIIAEQRPSSSSNLRSRKIPNTGVLSNYTCY